MKKIVSTFILLFVSGYFSYCQNPDTLLQKAINILKTDTELANQHFKEAIDLLNSNEEKLAFYASFGTELLYASELRLLNQVCKSALQLSFSDSSYSSYSLLQKHQFDYFNIKNEYDSALNYADIQYTLATEKSDSSSMVSTLVDVGGIFEKIGDYSVALEKYLKALEIAELSNNEYSIALVNLNIAIFYNSIDNPRRSISYNKKALDTYMKLGETIKSAQIYNNLGMSFDKLNLFDSASIYFEKGYALADQLGSEFGKAITKLNIGLNAYRKHEYFQSIKIFDDVFLFFNKISDDYGICLCYYNYCRIYQALGETDKAIEHGLKGFEIATKEGFTNELEGLSRHLSELYEERGDSKNALKFYKLFTTAKDSLTNDDKNQEIGRLESKFQLNKSLLEKDLLEREVGYQKATISSQKMIIIVSSIALFLFIAIVMLLIRQLKERKKLLMHIETQSNKLKELDQAKTRFFANISHDLRSPLTLILGALDKITERDYNILDQESKEMLSMGMKNGKRLLYLADEIMDLTRLEEGKVSLSFEYVKIVPYLRLLTKMFSSAAEIKSIKLKFESKTEDESILQLDPHQFEKIIYNLLSNAIKFTPENGHVEVSVQSDQQYIAIEIADSGAGIPKESLGLIFDRYYQSANAEYASQSGVGIGLALVKELVELHEGTITVNSSEKGSTFNVKIPFKKNDWVSQAIIPERSLDVVTRNSLWMDLQEEHERMQVSSISNNSPDAKTVLIVEDHKELRFYLKSILTSDFRVLLASNGASGLEVLQSEKIDLIITDLMMPYMDGFELIDQLKKDKELRKIPVLVVSARTDKDEKIDLIKKGAEDVISKPFDKEELFARINNILSREWDSTIKLAKLYGETAEEFEKSIMAKMERLIIKRIDDPHLTVLDLAEEMAASERKVYRMIKKISGLTPYELIKEVRWQYLANYLKNNKVSTATEAAHLIGMNNVSSFSEQYKKRFGSSIKIFLDEK